MLTQPLINKVTILMLNLKLNWQTVCWLHLTESLNAQTVGSVSPSGNEGDEELTAKGGSSLVDEGLRIAQQYGLGEFEEKLREMKREADKSVDEDVDDGEDGEDAGNSNCSEKKTSLASLSGQCNSWKLVF